MDLLKDFFYDSRLVVWMRKKKVEREAEQELLTGRVVYHETPVLDEHRNLTFTSRLDKVFLSTAIFCSLILLGFSIKSFIFVENIFHCCPLVVVTISQIIYLIMSYKGERLNELVIFFCNLIFIFIYQGILLLHVSSSKIDIFVTIGIFVALLVIGIKLFIKYKTNKVSLIRLVGTNEVYQDVLNLIHWFRVLVILNYQMVICFLLLEVDTKYPFHLRFSASIFILLCAFLFESILSVSAYLIVRKKKVWIFALYFIFNLPLIYYILLMDLYLKIEIQSRLQLKLGITHQLLRLLTSITMLVTKILLLTFAELFRWNFHIDVNKFMFPNIIGDPIINPEAAACSIEEAQIEEVQIEEAQIEKAHIEEAPVITEE